MPPTGDPNDRDDEEDPDPLRPEPLGTMDETDEDDDSPSRTFRISDTAETDETSKPSKPSETDETSEPAPDRDVSDTQTTDQTPKGGDTVAVLPYLGVLTYDELHAAYLGTTGLLVGIAYASGSIEEAIGFTLAAVGVAFGVRVMPRDMDVPGADHYRQTTNPAVTLLAVVPFLLKTAAARTLRKEPWYFCVIYALTFFAGIGLDRVLTGPG